MKWKLLALILLLSGLAIGQTITTSYRFTTSTPDVGTTANGGAANETNSGTQYRKITWTVTGTVATCSVRVDSSADNVTYTAGGAITAQTCTSNGASAINTGVFNYTRINVTAISGSGSVKVVYQGFPTSPSGGAVTSVFGRTGAVVGAATDYTGIPNLAFGDGTGMGILFTSATPLLQIGKAPGVAIQINGSTNDIDFTGTNIRANGVAIGTVSSVGETINGGASSGIFTVSGSPVTASGTINLATAGNSGGIACFTSGSIVSSSVALTSNTLPKGGGAGVCPTNSGVNDNGLTVSTAEAVNATVGPVYVGGATASTLSGFSFTDNGFGTTKASLGLVSGPLTSATTDAAALISMEPLDGVTTGQSFNSLKVNLSTDNTQTKNFTSLRGISLQTFPQTSGTITNLFGQEIFNQWSGTSAITTAVGLRIQSDSAGGTGTVTTNAGLQIFRTGFATNPGSAETITTDAGIVVGGPQTQANGTMTHHYGIQISGTHTGGTGNSDGWAIFDSTAANKVQLGTLSLLTSVTSPLYATTTNCAAVGTAADPSVASCSAAPAGAFSCATNASATTCTINTTAVTANSEIFVQEVADEGTRLGVTCNTAPTVVPAILVATKTAGTGFTINMPTITTNPACFNYWIVN